MCIGNSSTLCLISAIDGGGWAPGPICTGAENLAPIYPKELCLDFSFVRRVITGCDQYHFAFSAAIPK